MRATILGQPDFPIYLLARQPNAMPAEQTPNRYIPEEPLSKFVGQQSF